MDISREENDHETFCGIRRVSQRVSICVVDDDEKIAARSTTPADPSGVAGWLKNRSLKPERTVRESGQLSTWLQLGMAEVGLPAICIDARKAHKSLSARFNKSDSADAEGLAHWPVPIGLRLLTFAARTLIGCAALLALENA